jgi:hypothetical protein
MTNDGPPPTTAGQRFLDHCAKTKNALFAD